MLHRPTERLESESGMDPSAASGSYTRGDVEMWLLRPFGTASWACVCRFAIERLGDIDSTGRLRISTCLFAIVVARQAGFVGLSYNPCFGVLIAGGQNSAWSLPPRTPISRTLSGSPATYRPTCTRLSLKKTAYCSITLHARSWPRRPQQPAKA